MSYNIKLMPLIQQESSGRMPLTRVFSQLWQRRELIQQLTLRNIQGRYRGAYLGVLWALLYPFLMLAIYTFVFGVVLGARWEQSPGHNMAQFAVVLFCGLILFNIFSEIALKSPDLLRSNANFVKKVIFPTEILPAAELGSCLFHYLISFTVLLAGVVAFWGVPSATVFLMPLVLVPLAMFSLGVSWLLAFTGVFVRDLSQAVTVLVQVVFFATPIVYPFAAVPDAFKPLMRLNILTNFVEAARDLIIFGRVFNWEIWGWSTAASLAFFFTGYAVFIRGKTAYADVL